MSKPIVMGIKTGGITKYTGEFLIGGFPGPKGE